MSKTVGNIKVNGHNQILVRSTPKLKGNKIHLVQSDKYQDFDDVIELDKEAAIELVKVIQKHYKLEHPSDSLKRQTAFKKAADNIEGMKIGMVATFDSIEQVMEQYNVKGTDVAVMLIAINTALQIAANNLRKGEK